MSQLILSSPSRHAVMIEAAAASASPGQSPVAASWRRSLLHHKLDPRCMTRPDRLEARAIRQCREASEELLQAAAPMMDRLAGGLLDSGCTLVLADAQGVILDTRRRPGDEADFSMAGLSEGACWSEAAEGTNAIGTCLADGRATLIWRNQHFFARNLPLICISAPIEGPGGRLAGVLNFSSSAEGLGRVQSRLMALAVQDGAVQAGTALFHAAFPGARILSLGQSPGQSPGLGPSLLALDRDELVIGANRAARRVLEAPSGATLLGQPLSDLLGETGEAGAEMQRALRAELTRMLQRNGGNVTRTAKALGISRATLYRKMKAVGLERPDA